ncbi:rho guanine nucleotide exchange factor 10-like [Ruditapes philippinarum]|uniref:rho guanine nucleotide exchange factor 10-like n=1 Tax=Ruditapes philippinarum TaxID=129788 RepID=UPI00295B1992|nr:rho guanine nucleotide exchange factor 10-like [Ruditapes philippinarum]
MEHLWICSSNEGHGQVSVVSLHTDKPSLIESFQATKCMIICVETVPGYARVRSKAAFEEDTVWMSTSDSEIQVFMLSERQADLHRHCIYTFEVGCITISMRYIDDLMFCGNRNGKVIIFSRNDDGVWSESRRITLGLNPVTSLICVGDNMWAACGTKIYIIDIDTYEIQDNVEHQLTEKDDHTIHFEYLVKTGVGVWASFIGQPNICLYHSESRRLLQDFNICTAVHEFIKGKLIC